MLDLGIIVVVKATRIAQVRVVERGALTVPGVLKFKDDLRRVVRSHQNRNKHTQCHQIPRRWYYAVVTEDSPVFAHEALRFKQLQELEEWPQCGQIVSSVST